MADRLANAALKLHASPTPLQKASLEYYTRRAPHVARAIATALAAFPASEPTRLKRAQAPRDAEEAKRRQIHWWSFEEGRWRCAICCKWSTGEQLDRHYRLEACRGPRAEAEAKSWVGRGHRIVAARGAVSIAFCSKCGAWGNRRARKLRETCAAPTPAGVAALKNIAAGKHPWQRRLPKGGCAPRSRLRSIATYDEERDAWAPTETTRAPPVDRPCPPVAPAPQPPPRDDAVAQPPSQDYADAVMFHTDAPPPCRQRARPTHQR